MTGLTVRVNAHRGGSYVGCDREVRQPEVLDEGVAEAAVYRLIEVAPAEHGCHRIGEVEYLAPPLRHFLEIIIVR